MIAVVLAGGYARRLWPLTLDKPKVLLSIGGKPVLDYVIEKVMRVSPPVSKIIVSTNLKFEAQFEEWAKARRYDNVELLPDNSRSENEKVGAIKALSNIASATNEDFLVLAGDNIPQDELKDLIRFFDEKRSPVIAVHHAENFEEAKNGSTVTLDEDRRIAEFIEKPENPKTMLIGACIYAFPRRIATRLKEYVETSLPKDEPGRFIEWLHRKEPIYGCLLKGSLWDIGTIESYFATKRLFDGLSHN